MEVAVGTNDGDTPTQPKGEAKASDIVFENALWQDLGGPGKFRGGLSAGQRVESRYAGLVFGGSR